MIHPGIHCLPKHAFRNHLYDGLNSHADLSHLAGDLKVCLNINLLPHLYVRASAALVRLCICTDSPESKLRINVINTNTCISRTEP